MVKKSDYEAVLARALSSGADFAELFIQDKLSNHVSLSDGQIDNASTDRIHGAGLRIYCGLNSVYVHTNDVSCAGLMRIAEQAAGAVNGSGVAGSRDLHLVRSISPNAHPVAVLPRDVGGKRRGELLHRAQAAARSVSDKICQVQTSIADSDSSITIINSEGLWKEDRRVYTRFALSCVASDGRENQTGYEAPGALMGFELFDSLVDVEAIAGRAANTAVAMLDAEECPAGVMPVVIDNGFGGVIFHEACGHSLEATAVAFGNSEFTGKLGQQIASPIVTAIDDGTMPNEWGSINIDDEGAPSTRLVLIENGVLKNYMIDRLNGRRMNMKPTGSARRQDYTFAPTSRMRNTYIAPGTHDEAEIIASTGDGLYARQMGGGSVNPVTGEFNFAVREGYLIKNGKIDRPVRGATLIGRGAQVLMDIDRVGKNLALAQGMCGSVSGSIPTNVGQPMIRVSRMTVGGRS